MNAAASSRLLVVLPLIPWPIRRDGLSVRFAPIIDYLARRYELDVLILGEDTESEQRVGPLELCGLLTVIQVPIMTLPTPMRKLRIAWSGLVPWEPPFGASRHFDRRKLEEAIADYLNGKSYASIVWAAGHFDVALRIRAKYPAVRFVVDFVDSPTLAFSRAVYLRPDQQALFLYTKWKWRYLERRVQGGKRARGGRGGCRSGWNVRQGVRGDE